MKTFSVKESITRLNEDSPDNELMQTYGLSSDELYGLYEQLFVLMADGSLYVQTSRDTY
jgi:hypothetical protein